MNQLTLELLGAFQVAMNQKPVVAFESNKARALLAYLAVEAGQAQPRTTLVGLFWPEIREENARDNLRHALTNLRKLLPNDDGQPPFLLIDRQSVQFNRHSHYQLDVAEFTQAVAINRQPASSDATATERIAHLEQATTLYHGPFLSGFFFADCSALEEWLLLTRERLHNQMLGALDHLSNHFEQQQAYDKAEQYARQLLTLDNLQEAAYCTLMRILALQGQRSAALHQYEQCRALLAKELGAPPRAETVKLQQEIQRGLWEGKPALPVVIAAAPAGNGQATPATPAHNLPVPVSSFIGRTRQVSEIRALLRQPAVRLLTLHGTGGVGKTRLAIQAARQLLGSFPDGCAWVELAPLQAAVQVPLAIAQSLAIRVSAGGDPLQLVKNHLRHRQTLLVLDNYEHLLDAAPIVSELLRHAEQLKCLVTSREPLHVQGEQEYAVTALTLPTAQPLASATNRLPQELLAFEALQLFATRAQAVKADFVLDSHNAIPVAEICVRLDGLPLAIELAAARCKFFPPQVIQQKLNGSALRFLQNGARDVPTRHQTLYRTIAWSYDLLTEPERHLFRTLAIFVGGCTLPAVERVCSLASSEETDRLATLHSLVDKNLVQQTINADGEPRFLLLETLREFALQQLTASAEGRTIHQRHADYYDEVANQLCWPLVGPNHEQYMARLRAEIPNIRAALQWFLAQQMAERSLSLCNTFAAYWHHVNDKEAFDYFAAALQLGAAQPPTPDYINALANAGYTCFVVEERGSAHDYFTECLRLNSLLGNVGDPVKIGTAHGLLAWVAFEQGDYLRAREHFAAAKENDRTKGDEWTYAMTLANHGKMEARIGEFDAAHRLLDEALQRLQNFGDAWSIVLTLQNRCRTYLLQNQIAAAAEALAQSEIFYQKAPTDMQLAESKRLTALVALHQNAYEHANQALKEALLLRQKVGAPRYVLEMLETALLVFIHQGRLVPGLVIAGATMAYRLARHVVAAPAEKQMIEGAIALARQQLPAQSAATAWAAGETMTLDEALAYAVAEEPSTT